MAEQAKAEVDQRQFYGLVAGQDPHDLPPGAAVIQVNLALLDKGELTVRGGLREVTFDAS